jgi:hypothetical protein
VLRLADVTLIRTVRIEAGELVVIDGSTQTDLRPFPFARLAGAGNYYGPLLSALR